MRQRYTAPVLMEYGRMDQLTLGNGGTLPDLNQNLVVVNNNCPTFTSATFTRVACINYI